MKEFQMPIRHILLGLSRFINEEVYLYCSYLQEEKCSCISCCLGFSFFDSYLAGRFLLKPCTNLISHCAGIQSKLVHISLLIYNRSLYLVILQRSFQLLPIYSGYFGLLSDEVYGVVGIIVVPILQVPSTCTMLN